MKAGQRRILPKLAQALAVVVVTWALFRMVGVRLEELDALRAADWQPAAGPLAASAAVLLVVYLAHALLWRAVMADLDVGRPSVRTAIRVYFLASLGRYVPGKFWQVAGTAMLSHRAGLPPVGATAAAVLGQVAFLVTGAVFLAIVLPTGRAAAAAASGAGAALGALLVARSQAGKRLASTLRNRLPRLAPLVDLAGRIRPAAAARWALAYGLTWVVLGGAFILFVRSFEPGAAAHGRYVAGAVAASYLGGYIALFAPAGIGVREGVMGVLLAQVMPAPAAVVVALASRVWFTAVELLPLLALPLLRDRTAAPRRNPMPEAP
jgi:hypothetical protein